MTQPPNRISQFWQELKRRKVVRVITVYAAAAFVILELVDIITEPFGLPVWTLKLVVVLLSIGLVVSVILSWIYDIHPEGGIVKTESAISVKEEDIPASSNTWKVASYISFVVIVALIVLNIIPRTGNREIIDKSIAVLPFKNDSPNQERMYFINGTMEAILDNLCKIEDLRVVSRNSVEQYRTNPKSTPVVAKEMNVGYILEGSGHRDGNNVRLVVQLLDGKKDQHIWSKTYDADIEEIFSLQSEIAQLVAAEIEAIITPQEKQLIEKIPTTSLTALDFYQRGREEYWKYKFENDTSALNMAYKYFQKAIGYDSTLAQAYTGLAWVYYEQKYIDTYLSEEFLDSLLILTDTALSYDNKLADAYTLRGIYFRDVDPERALDEFNRALQLNPNDWVSYRYKAWLYLDYPVKRLENLYKAAEMNRGQGLAGILSEISFQYYSYGFYELGQHYAEQALALNADSAEYYNNLSTEFDFTKNIKYYENLKNVIKHDPNHLQGLYDLGEYLSMVGRHKESLENFEKFLEIGGFFTNGIQRIGYAYWHNGDREKANYYFEMQVQYALAEIEQGRYWATHLLASYYDLATISAFRRENTKALEYLGKFSNGRTFPIWWISLIQNDPMLENVRLEPEFQQIVGKMEAKYQAEHERVRQWLVENDLL